MAWSEVAGSYDLTLGDAAPVPQIDRLKRGFVDDIKDTVDWAKGDFNVSRARSFLMEAGQPNERTNIFSDTE